jgi:hypothetical protein
LADGVANADTHQLRDGVQDAARGNRDGQRSFGEQAVQDGEPGAVEVARLAEIDHSDRRPGRGSRPPRFA